MTVKLFQYKTPTRKSSSIHNNLSFYMAHIDIIKKKWHNLSNNFIVKPDFYYTFAINL